MGSLVFGNDQSQVVVGGNPLGGSHDPPVSLAEDITHVRA